MPSHLPTLPRIRVDLLDSSPYSISPSSTLDIEDISSRAKLLPMLSAEDFVFADGDDALCFEDGHLPDFPSFPMGRQPPLFILNSHRAQLPFHLRPDAFELGDFCRGEEDIRSLLTAPTVPRMKMVIKEQLYVQKWVDALIPDNPPKHIPWTCERPTTKKDWIAEGSVFPADRVKSTKYSIEQRGVIQKHSCVTDMGRFSFVGQASLSRDLYALSGAPSPIDACTELHAATPQVHPKSADVNPGILRERKEFKPSHILHRPVKASHSPALLLPATSSTTDAPLAARRGKSLSGLKLTAGVIERLEYPDIPTAFRGSPIIWSPRFDTFPVPSFTDHEKMLLDLKSKCAALSSVVAPYIQEPLHPQIDHTRTSLGFDEWAFTRGLATFDDCLGSIDSPVSGQIVADTSIFLPDDTSTPVKSASFAACLKFTTRLPTEQSPRNGSSDPPGVPLPPRPALVNPSTPPHVRGILKKVKSVRFEDIASADHTSPVALESQASPPVAVPSQRPCTPMPKAAKLSSSPVLAKEASGKGIQKKSALRSRPPSGRVKAKENRPINVNASDAPEPCKSTTATTLTDRPCRIARAKENTNPTTVPCPQAKQRGLSVDVRRGIEGTAKSRLSTPLRNIFRFR